ncbi:hypothetical protein Droror1_Dr00022615 [Drosera rotundifolia]
MMNPVYEAGERDPPNNGNGCGQGAVAAAIVIMGVSGAGKTTIGKILAEALCCDFLDADDFHPESNKEKMRNGIPLCDADRMPWLETIRNVLRGYILDRKPVVLACSALRKMYRETLRTADPRYTSGAHCNLVKFVFLDVSAEILAKRMSERAAERKHFMPVALLRSQLDLLEIDPVEEGILHVDGAQKSSPIVSNIQDFILGS